jgi:hypothetical protein
MQTRWIIRAGHMTEQSSSMTSGRWLCATWQRCLATWHKWVRSPPSPGELLSPGAHCWPWPAGSKTRESKVCGTGWKPSYKAEMGWQEPDVSRAGDQSGQYLGGEVMSREPSLWNRAVPRVPELTEEKL